MKKYTYTCTSNTVWASFDEGEVTAQNRDGALIKAEAEITFNLDRANAALAKLGDGLSISMDMDQIEVTEVIEKEPVFNHAMNMSFTVLSDTEDSPSPEEIRTGLQRAFKLCKDDDDELVDRCEIHDTFEV